MYKPCRASEMVTQAIHQKPKYTLVNGRDQKTYTNAPRPNIRGKLKAPAPSADVLENGLSLVSKKPTFQTWYKADLESGDRLIIGGKVSANLLDPSIFGYEVNKDGSFCVTCGGDIYKFFSAHVTLKAGTYYISGAGAYLYFYEDYQYLSSITLTEESTVQIEGEIFNNDPAESDNIFVYAMLNYGLAPLPFEAYGSVKGGTAYEVDGAPENVEGRGRYCVVALKRIEGGA